MPLCGILLDERDGLDDVIMDHYRKLQEAQFALFKDVGRRARGEDCGSQERRPL